MSFLRRMLDGLYTKTIYNSLPWLFLLIGTSLLAVGEFGSFNSTQWNELFEGMGKSIIAGGIVSLLLKSMQLLGIIKEELSKIISDPDYLKNRHDLEEYWDKVTCALFENKFPAINSLITKNIKRSYLPTKEVHYYENSVEILEIDLIDTALDIVRVVEKISFSIVPSSVPYSYIYPYKIEIKGDASYVPTFTLDYVKVNDNVVEVPVNEGQNENNLTRNFNLEVSGNHNKYLIEYQITRTYPLRKSSLITFKNNHIHHNYRVQLFFRGVKVDFYEAGLIAKFKTNYETGNFIEKEFNGLLDKGQGFMLFLTKNELAGQNL